LLWAVVPWAAGAFGASHPSPGRFGTRGLSPRRLASLIDLAGPSGPALFSRGQAASLGSAAGPLFDQHNLRYKQMHKILLKVDRRRVVLRAVGTAYVVFGQVLRVGFCFAVLWAVSSAYDGSIYQVTVVGLVFFVYAHLILSQMQAAQHRNAQFGSVIKALASAPEIGTRFDEMHKEFTDAMEKNESRLAIASVGNFLVYAIACLFILAAIVQ
jgi:hypothetical protein